MNLFSFFGAWTAPCAVKVEVEFCARLSAVDGRLSATVTQYDGNTQILGTTNEFCGAVASGIAVSVRDSDERRQFLKREIENGFSDQLTRYDFRPNVDLSIGQRCAETGICSDPNGYFGPLDDVECVMRPGTETNACRWRVPVERVEMLPSGLLLVFAEEETSPFAEFLRAPIIESGARSMVGALVSDS